MNPVLLKPGSDRRSQVVVLGRPAGRSPRATSPEAAASWPRRRSRRTTTSRRGTTWWSARAPAARRDQPARVGLRQHGPGPARRMPTVVVGDIDRGGVFAAMFGTLALLDAEDQALVAGFVVNKFRGDVGLLRPGLDMLAADRPAGARRAAVAAGPVAGLRGRARLRRRRTRGAPTALRVGRAAAADQQLHRPRRARPRARPGRGLHRTAGDARRRRPGGAARHPGDRRRPGLAAGARPGRRGVATRARGGPVLGICGGFQMLARRSPTRTGSRGGPGHGGDGLGLLDVRTRSAPRRCCCRRRGARAPGRLRDPPRPVRVGAARRSWAAPVTAGSSGRCGTAASRGTPSPPQGGGPAPPRPPLPPRGAAPPPRAGRPPPPPPRRDSLLPTRPR